MSFTPHRASPPRKSKPPRTAEVLDIAARYFVYKLMCPVRRGRSHGIPSALLAKRRRLFVGL